MLKYIFNLIDYFESLTPTPYLIPNILIAALSIYIVVNPFYEVSYPMCIGPAALLMGLTLPPSREKTDRSALLNMSRNRFISVISTLAAVCIWTVVFVQ